MRWRRQHPGASSLAKLRSETMAGNPFTRLLRRLAQRRAIKRYLTVLPRRLIADYGHAGPYTPAQVEMTIQRYRISEAQFISYALAIFCDRAVLAQLPHEVWTTSDFDALRSEVAGAYFSGDREFSYRDVEAYSAHHGATSGVDGHHVQGGGHIGADSGGGHH